MNSNVPPVAMLQQFLSPLAEHTRRWLLPAVVIALAAVVYALVRPPTWEASQALSLREEAIGGLARPGRFHDLNDMKTAQETVLELARSQTVVAEALAQIGPPAGHAADATWPAPRDIEDAQDAIQIKAPTGAEFGRTEVFYLKVKGPDRRRATALAAAVCDRVEAQLQQLRDQKAQSLVAELQKTASVANADLGRATAHLAAMERELGSDLAELRTLNEPHGGEGNLRTTLTQIRNELRQVRLNDQANRQLLELLRAAQDDATQLVATPNRLLESQPALRRLKDGLVDAQLRTSQLLGTMSREHPLVRAGLMAEEEVRTHLHDELELAIRGLEVELQVSAAQVGALAQQQTEVENRMSQISGLRAQYNNLVDESRRRAEILAKSDKDLTDARASLAAAHSSSLLTRLGTPETGSRPVGPGRTAIAVAGIFGGLVTGIGWVFLTVPIPAAAAPPAAPAAKSAPVHRERTSPARSAPAAGHGLSLKEALLRLSWAAQR